MLAQRETALIFIATRNTRRIFKIFLIMKTLIQASVGAGQYSSWPSSPSHDWALTDGEIEVNDGHGSFHLDWLLSSFRFWWEWEGRKWSDGRMAMGGYTKGEEREEWRKRWGLICSWEREHQKEGPECHPTLLPRLEYRLRKSPS